MNEQQQQLVKAAVNTLIEHFDSVRIFVTSHNGEETATFTSGRGNFYAQLGSITEWKATMDQEARDRSTGGQ